SERNGPHRSTTSTGTLEGGSETAQQSTEGVQAIGGGAGRTPTSLSELRENGFPGHGERRSSGRRFLRGHGSGAEAQPRRPGLLSAADATPRPKTGDEPHRSWTRPARVQASMTTTAGRCWSRRRGKSARQVGTVWKRGSAAGVVGQATLLYLRRSRARMRAAGVVLAVVVIVQAPWGDGGGRVVTLTLPHPHGFPMNCLSCGGTDT